MCCIVAPGHHIGLGFLLQVIKCAVFSLTLPALGIYVPRLIGPSELKITPMRTEPENVLSISSCWRHQRAKTYPAFSSFLSSPFLFSFSSLPFCRSSLTLSPPFNSSVYSSIPLSLSFLPPPFFFFQSPALSGPFNSPAHDQMLN